MSRWLTPWRREIRDAVESAGTSVQDRNLIGCTDDLRKDPLYEHPHDGTWIREDGLDDLCFLADGDADFLEEGIHSGFGPGSRCIRIANGPPAFQGISES